MSDQLLSLFENLDMQWEKAINNQEQSLKELQQVNDDLLYIDYRIRASYKRDDKTLGNIDNS